ncbi:MAG: 50S ribosomal protein L30 [Thermodesulfobacteriota bacterium]|nr:50S ribosomal protein L30 [Thermodesulfobacteriota bacterium]
MADKIKITLKRSVIGSTKKQKEIIRSLGLKKRGRSKTLPDNACVRGSIKKMEHLLEWEEI